MGTSWLAHTTAPAPAPPRKLPSTYSRIDELVSQLQRGGMSFATAQATALRMVERAGTPPAARGPQTLSQVAEAIAEQDGVSISEAQCRADAVTRVRRVKPSRPPITSQPGRFVRNPL